MLEMHCSMFSGLWKNLYWLILYLISTNIPANGLTGWCFTPNHWMSNAISSQQSECHFGHRRQLPSIIDQRMSLYISLCHDSQHAVAKFSESRVWDRVLEGSILIFGDTLISLKDGIA